MYEFIYPVETHGYVTRSIPYSATKNFTKTTGGKLLQQKYTYFLSNTGYPYCSQAEMFVRNAG